MTDFECRTVYFEKTGRGNTDMTLRLAKARADHLGIRSVVVASSTGVTGVKASDVFKGYNVIIVASVVGFSQPNVNRLLPENRSAI